MKQKKPDKRKLQGAETKRKLYAIAEKLLFERNFNEVSIEDITSEAGITKGAFYVHFASKDALMAQLIADHAVQVDTNYQAFLDTLPEDWPVSQVLLALAEKIAEIIADTIGCKNLKAVYQLMLAGTVDVESVKGYTRSLYTMCCRVLEKGILRGEIDSPLSAEELTRHFVMSIRGVCYEWCVRYPDFDLKAQVREHIQMLLQGICVNKPSY